MICIAAMFVTTFSVISGNWWLPSSNRSNIDKDIYIILDTLLKRFEKQIAAKQEQFLPVTRSFTLFQCALAYIDI